MMTMSCSEPTILTAQALDLALNLVFQIVKPNPSREGISSSFIHLNHGSTSRAASQLTHIVEIVAWYEHDFAHGLFPDQVFE
jgi:protein involved in temperature-dependent protein secretion